MNCCLLDISSYVSKRHFKVNMSKSNNNNNNKTNKLLTARPSLNLLLHHSSPTQSTAIPYFQLLGPKILGVILEFSFTPHIQFISNPAHTGFETHPKSDLFSPFPVTTLVPASITSHLDYYNNFQYGLFAYIFLPSSQSLLHTEKIF